MKKVLSVPLVLLTCLSARAGGGGVIAGDGGYGVLCPRYGGQIPVEQVESLDLFEARRAFKSHWSTVHPSVQLDFSDVSLRDQKSLMKKLLGAQHWFLRVFDHAMSLHIDFHFISIPETNDFGKLSVTLPNRCHLVQLASYSNRSGEESISLNTEYAEFLDQRDFAALLLHESLHAYFPRDKNSQRIRKIVGFVFADDDFQKRHLQEFLRLIAQ